MAEITGQEKVQIKPAAYLRLSREDGDDCESNSITNQRAIILDFARSRGYEITKEYVDDGFTGSNFERPGFKEMIQDIRDGVIDCVIVKDLSRFGRNLVECGRYIDQLFPVWRVRFIAINDFYDTARNNNASDSLTVSLKNMVNEMYCHDISMKIKATMDMKRRRGDFIGNYPPYGYRKDPENHNRLLIDENEAPIIRMIYELKLDGMNTRGIAGLLNELGVKSPGKRIMEMGYKVPKAKNEELPWNFQSVVRILTEESYTGTLVQGRYKKKSFKRYKLSTTDKSEWFRAENGCPAIIDRRTFDYVQDLNRRSSGTAKGETFVYTFSGFLRCGDCGQPMRRTRVNQHGHTTISYLCGEHVRNKNCSYHRIREDVIVREVATAMRERIEFLLLVEEKLISHKDIPNRTEFTESMMTSVDRKLKDAIDRMAYLQDGQARVYGDMMSGTLDKDGYRQFSELFTKSIAKMDDEIKELQKAKERLFDDRYYLIPWMESLRQYRNFTEISRRLLVLVVEDIFIYEGAKVKVTFRHEQQIEDLLKMVLEKDEKIVVQKQISIDDDFKLKPVGLHQLDIPMILPYFGPEETDDNGMAVCTVQPKTESGD